MLDASIVIYVVTAQVVNDKELKNFFKKVLDKINFD